MLAWLEYAPSVPKTVETYPAFLDPLSMTFNDLDLGDPMSVKCFMQLEVFIDAAHPSPPLLRYVALNSSMGEGAALPFDAPPFIYVTGVDAGGGRYRFGMNATGRYLNLTLDIPVTSKTIVRPYLDLSFEQVATLM